MSYQSSNTRVAFCFIIKDGETYLRQNIERILKLSEHFAYCYIRYIENDSKDSTCDILSEMERTHPNTLRGQKLHIDGKISTELCGPNDGFNCSARTRRLAYLRQLVLQDGLSLDVDLLVMLDLDFVDFDDDIFLRMVEVLLQSTKINGIFGMSVFYNSPSAPYDCGAIVPIYRLLHIVNSSSLVPVQSAFSGFGVYRVSALREKKASYDLTCTNIEHIAFNLQLDGLFVYPQFRPQYKGSCEGYSVPFLIHFGQLPSFIIVAVCVVVGIVGLLCFLIYSITKMTKRYRMVHRELQ